MRQERRGFCLPTRLAWTLLAGLLVVLALALGHGFADEYREARLSDDLTTLEYRVPPTTTGMRRPRASRRGCSTSMRVSSGWSAAEA